MKYKLIIIFIISLLILWSCWKNKIAVETNTWNIVKTDLTEVVELSKDEMEIQFQKDLEIIKTKERAHELFLEERLKEDNRLEELRKKSELEELDRLYELEKSKNK